MIDMLQYIYFVRIVNGPIKIGISSNVLKRFKILQVYCPYEMVLMGCISGIQKDELKIFSHLVKFRLHSEWFEYSIEVENYVHKLLQNGKYCNIS